MPIFSCRECGCIENTALSNYWTAVYEDTPVLCSACDPETSKWHGEFPRRSASGMLVDQNGQLWSAADVVPKHYKILGSVAASPAPQVQEEGEKQ